MSDNLTTRLNAITSRQDATNDLLADILAALGTLTPIDNTAALGDILSAIGTGNTTLSNIYSRLGTTNSLLTSANEALESIDTTLAQTLTFNQNIIGPYLEDIFFATTGLSCICDTEAPALPPGYSTDPAEVGSELCQRVQYWLNALLNTLNDAQSNVATGGQITAQIALLLLATGGIPGVDLGTIPLSLVSGLVTLILAGGGLILQGCIDFIGDNYSTLRDALFTAGNAANGKTAFDAIVDASGTNPTVKGIMKLLSWSGGLNVIYDFTVEWDVDELDGGVCGFAPGTCFFFDSSFVEGAQRITFTAPLSGVTNTPIAPFTVRAYDAAIFLVGNYSGWTVFRSSGTGETQVQYSLVGGSTILSQNITSAPFTMPENTAQLTVNDSLSFELQICSPEPA